MKTITATSARSGLFNIIKDAAATHRLYRITSRAGTAVLIPEEDFDGLLETLELLSTPGVLAGVRKARREIAEGKTYSIKEVFGS
jgi:antitoxin YefM